MFTVVDKILPSKLSFIKTTKNLLLTSLLPGVSTKTWGNIKKSCIKKKRKEKKLNSVSLGLVLGCPSTLDSINNVQFGLGKG